MTSQSVSLEKFIAFLFSSKWNKSGDLISDLSDRDYMRLQLTTISKLKNYQVNEIYEEVKKYVKEHSYKQYSNEIEDERCRLSCEAMDWDREGNVFSDIKHYVAEYLYQLQSEKKSLPVFVMS